jgi:tetratricopeptide (TPR) repeat protein
VLSEEALILIAVVGACALLVLGVMELVWPSKPRHPVRHLPPAPPKPVARAKTAAAPAHAAPVRRRRSKVSPHARRHAGAAVGAEPREDGTAAPPPAPVPSEPALAGSVAAPAGDGAAPADPPAKREPDPLLVDTCFSLYQDRCYAEVVSLGEAALAKVRAEALTEEGAHDRAALWSVVALAKQALGDDEGARVALETACEICPSRERPTYRQHLAALALNASRTWLARAHSHETEDRVAALRTALGWIARGLDAVPADDRLDEARGGARRALWPAYEQAVHKHLQRQEFEEARRLLREALDEPDVPPARVEEFQELLSGTFGGEIGQLTAQAIRSMQEERESEALASLRRAEELLAAIPDEALPPKRREEVDQRLWWGYTRLGVRRVESGEYEAALEPLVHALRFAAISPDRQEETRAALVRALDGVADVRALSIRQLADEGNRDEAVLRTEALRELLRSCLELGVAEDKLSVAFARTRRLFEELGMEDHA